MIVALNSMQGCKLSYGSESEKSNPLKEVLFYEYNRSGDPTPIEKHKQSKVRKRKKSL